MSSFYRFNISQNGTFWARIDDEFMGLDQAQKRTLELRKRFSASEGFKVELTRWECAGYTITV